MHQKSKAPSTPQQQQLIRSVAVQAVRLLSRTRISSGRSSHASKERAHPHPHLLLVLLLSVLVVVHGPQQTAVQHTQRRTAQSGVTWVHAADVPHALLWKEESAHGSV